jgi:AcrR family transcriptional regulator
MTAPPVGSPPSITAEADPPDLGVDRARTRLNPQARREQIITAAEHLFGHREPAEVTFEQIAEAAGVSRALVYNYFGDKGGLLAAVYLRSIGDLDLALARAFTRSGSGEERLRAIIGCYLDYADANAAACRLISWAEACEHPLVQQARRRRYQAVARSWGPSTDARMIARGVLSLLEGVVLEWLDDPASDRARTEGVLFSLLWSGLAAFPDAGTFRPGSS